MRDRECGARELRIVGRPPAPSVGRRKKALKVDCPSAADPKYPDFNLSLHSRVQYLRGLGGGRFSTGGASPSTRSTRKPFRLAVGVFAPE
jgi:hypothetical protein